MSTSVDELLPTRDLKPGQRTEVWIADVVGGSSELLPMTMQNSESGKPVVAVVGSGYMGGGIAQVLALAGYEVRIADVTAEIAVANRERLIAESARFEAQGLFPAASTDVLTRQLLATTVADAVGEAGFIEEAVSESLEVKKSTLAAISTAAPADALIATNTSTISITVLAAAVGNPERFLGVHFSNPAPFIPGVEIIPHAGTARWATDRAASIVEQTGKSAVTIRDVTGFVLNRLQYALFTEAARIVEEGITDAAGVDTIVRSTFGFRLPFFGPFAIADMAGLDVYSLCYRQLHEAYGDRFAPPRALEELVAQGHLGTKSGGGVIAKAGEAVDDLVAYRDLAYARMAQLLAQLGPSPLLRQRHA
jgi:3-hydroxybutyryl-CoA dehydrogenase